MKKGGHLWADFTRTLVNSINLHAQRYASSSAMDLVPIKTAALVMEWADTIPMVSYSSGQIVSLAFSFLSGQELLIESLKSFALYRDTTIPLLHLKPFSKLQILGLGYSLFHQFN